MTIIKILLILAVLALLLVLLRSHGTNRGGAYVKIGMAIFLAFAAYAVIRPEDVTWVAAQLGVGRGTDLVLYLMVVGFGFFAISTYLRFKEMELKYARLARAIALADAERRDALAVPPARGPDGSAAAQRGRWRKYSTVAVMPCSRGTSGRQPRSRSRARGVDGGRPQVAEPGWRELGLVAGPGGARDE